MNPFPTFTTSDAVPVLGEFLVCDVLKAGLDVGA